MDENLSIPGVLSGTAIRAGAVTPEMVHRRTRELALLAGHTPPHVTQADYEQAKQELHGAVR